MPRLSVSRRLPVARAALLVALFLSARRAAAEPFVVHVQPSPQAAAFDGWGTSLCWFANAVGRWPEPQRTRIMDALFTPDGLELTVVRYNIGGGEPADHHHMPWARQMEGFEPQPGQWDWAADPGQRWVLEAAIARGANRLEAFSNSPPYWMTVSQCAAGATDANADNLDPKHEAAFVDYLVQVARHFQSAWHVTFDTLEPFNEPFTAYWYANHNQEGCHFDRASQARVIRELRTALDRAGLGRMQVSAADETSVERAIGTWESYDAATRACVGQINTHAYSTERRDDLRRLAALGGKPLVMSEVDGGGNAPHDHAGIAPALELAERIVGDLRELRPLRWVFWQAVEDEPAPGGSNNNWGLIHADLKGDTHTWALTKKYYAMAQFSKFIRPGAVLTPCDADETIAAFDAAHQTLVLVTRHGDPEDEPVTYDLSGFGPRAGRVQTFRTSAAEDLAQLPATTFANGRFTAVARGQSITTYVVTW